MLYKSMKALAKLQAGVLALVLVAGYFPFSAGAVDALPENNNPELSGSCGLDIVLVMDTSGSIEGDSTSGELDQMQTALQGFAAALSSTPSVFALVSFDDAATLQEPFMANAATIDAAIEGTDGNGATNWEAGLEAAAAQFDPRPSVPNVVVFASDGDPTVNNGSDATTSTTDGNDVSNAVAEADALKVSGTRIITVGIGNSVTQANLVAISSADAYYNAANFAALGDTLDEVVTELCGGTLNVSKVIDADGNLETTDDQTAGEGWTFEVNGSEKLTGLVTGAFSVETSSNTAYSVNEVADSGYTFVDATCVKGSGENAVEVGTWDETNPSVTGLTVGDQEVVSCTFYNTPIPDENPEDPCPQGQHLEGEICVPDETPEEPTCPEGQHLEGEVCVPNDDGGEGETDVCSNIDGVQSELPDGMKFSNGDNCVKQKRSGGGGGNSRNTGDVLGATTCGPLLTKYLHIGWDNDTSEVTKLQEFLNSNLGIALPVSGFFGQDTFGAVEQFQLKYGADILNPWVGFPASGITGPTTPTGFVYQTTRWQINNIWCPGSEAFPETLI